MSSIIFPPRSALARVRNVHLKVNMTGSGPSILEEPLKQCIRMVTNEQAGEIKCVSSRDNPDAFLTYHVETAVLTTGADGKAADYSYLLRVDLLATVPGAPEDEAYNIWSYAEMGSASKSDLYESLVGSCRLQFLRLIDVVAESRSIK